MQFFSNLVKFFDTVTAELTKIALPAMAMIIVAIGFMWISGDRGAEKGKSWIFKLLVGGLFIFGGSVLAQTLKNMYGF